MAKYAPLPFPGTGEMADPGREGKGGIENKLCKVKEVSTLITTNYGAYQGEKAWDCVMKTKTTSLMTLHTERHFCM